MKSMNQSLVHRLRRQRWVILARCRALRGDRGSAIVELALVMSFFSAPLLLGVFVMATLIYGSIEVSNAAHAGAMYGMQNATLAGESSGITAAAQTEASDFGANLTVTPTTYYACSAALGGTQYSTQSAATAACTGSGNHSLEFVQVAVSAPVTSPFNCPPLPASFTLRSISVMEVEE